MHKSGVSRRGPGQIIPDYEFSDRVGDAILLSDFRGGLDLLLIVLRNSASTEYLKLRQSPHDMTPQFPDHETKIVVAARPEQREPLANLGDQLLVVADDSGRAMPGLGAPAISITAVVAGAVGAFLGVALIAAGFAYKGRQEEQRLGAAFGEAFAAHRHRTGMFLPRLF